MITPWYDWQETKSEYSSSENSSMLRLASNKNKKYIFRKYQITSTLYCIIIVHVTRGYNKYTKVINAKVE